MSAAMEQLQEIVRSTSARAARTVAESPVRFSERPVEPLSYDTQGLDAEKLGYRLGTLAVAAFAVPYLMSESVLRRNWEEGGARGSLCLGLSVFAVARVTWSHVSEWPTVHHLGGVLLQTLGSGSHSVAGTSRSSPEQQPQRSTTALADDLPTAHFARELLPDPNAGPAAVPAVAEVTAPQQPAPPPEPEPEPEPEARSQRSAWSQGQERAASATRDPDRHPRVPSLTGPRSGSRVAAHDELVTTHPIDADGIVEDLVAEERREAERKRRSRVRSHPFVAWMLPQSSDS